MAFIGVLISWLMLARNIDLACVAISATSLAWASGLSRLQLGQRRLGGVASRANLLFGRLALNDVRIDQHETA